MVSRRNQILPAKLVVFVMLLIGPAARAQPNGAGLAGYSLGVTTPDSLPVARFREQPVYAKGTIALSCNHVRVFTADSVNNTGISMTHLALLFYDNRLFRIDCAYTDAVKKAVLATYANGTPVPRSQLVVCEAENDKPVLLWGEVWQWGNNQARVMHADGYGADCERYQTVRFSITSQRFSALSSDCDLTAVDPFREAFDRLLNKRAPNQDPPKPKRRVHLKKRTAVAAGRGLSTSSRVVVLPKRSDRHFTVRPLRSLASSL